MNDNLPTMTRDEWAECMGIEDDQDAREREADRMRDRETDRELGHGQE